MTLTSRHRIQNSSAGGLRPSTLPFGHGGSHHNIESLRLGGEKHFVSLKLEGHSGVRTPRSPTLQAGNFNQGPRPIWGLANQVSYVLIIIILTFWWLEYRMSEVLTLCVVDYHMFRVSHISFINRLGLDCQMSLIFTF